MKINVMSDLHLEFASMALPGGDVLLLAGDICVAGYLTNSRTDARAREHQKICDKFFYQECKKYSKVYYIAGNHEHYHGVFDHTVEKLKQFLAGSNVTVLDNEMVDLGDWNLFGATLWTDYNKDNFFAKLTAGKAMNDHHIIHKVHKNGVIAKFSPEDAYEEHKKTIAILDETLYNWEVVDKPTIVMGHHGPTYKSIHLKYGVDDLNYAYSSDLSEVIFRHTNIKYWFHGHTHDSFDYMVGDCRVIANPRGYARKYTSDRAGEPENKSFNVDFELEI